MVDGTETSDPGVPGPVSKHAQHTSTSVRGDAPLGHSANANSVTRDLRAVKGLIRWEFRSRHASLPWRAPSGGHRPARGRVRARPERPHGRNGRRKVHARRSDRPAVGGRASADLVRTGEDWPRSRPSSSVQTAAKSSCAARFPRRAAAARSSTTRSPRRRRCANWARTLVDLHGQHEHQALLDPAEHVDCSMPSPSATPNAAPWPRRFDEWRAAPPRLERSQLDEREKRARIEIASFHLQEIDKVAPPAARTTRWRASGPCWPTPIASAGCRGGLRRALRGRAAPRSARSRRCGSGSAIWRRSTRASRPTSSSATTSSPRSKTWRSFSRSYAGDLDASPDAAGRRGPPRRARAAEAEVRPRARRRPRARGDLADGTGGARRERRACRGTGERRARRARRRFSRPRARSPGRAASAAGTLARALERDAGRTGDAEVARRDSRPGRRALGRVDGAAASTTSSSCFSPNPGEEVRPLARIASGGELSRVMLALRTLRRPRRIARARWSSTKSTRASAGQRPTRWAPASRPSAARDQVICITHLAADRGARRHPLPDRQARSRRPHRHRRHAARRRRARDGRSRA